MVLENICGPALLYLGFSIIQIIIDLYKGLYNTSLIKFIIMIVFTIILNILCEFGLTLISWFIVFLPFISMSVITTLLLFVFDLDPSKGNINKTNSSSYVFKHDSNGSWKVIFNDGTTEIINLINGMYTLNNNNYKLENTDPISIKWDDGSLHTLDYIDKNNIIYWKSTSKDKKYKTILWFPIRNDLQKNIVNNNLECPDNITPLEYNMFYGGTCIPKINLSNSFNYNHTGQYKVTYYNGTSDYIEVKNGSYTINGITYTIENTNPITINWPNSDPPVIQTLNIIDTNQLIKWTTNSSDPKYSLIIWEPVTITDVQRNSLYT